MLTVPNAVIFHGTESGINLTLVHYLQPPHLTTNSKSQVAQDFSSEILSSSVPLVLRPRQLYFVPFLLFASVFMGRGGTGGVL